MKLLINDEPISNFQLRTTLQASKKTTKYKYKDSLVYELLQQATREWKEYNIWQYEGQIRMLGEFMDKFIGKKHELI